MICVKNRENFPYNLLSTRKSKEDKDQVSIDEFLEKVSINAKESVVSAAFKTYYRLIIMANVFNTFSFNKWADSKREEEIDKESRRRRTEQIKRLKERLRKERELRESGGNGDLDLEALIEALQSGEEINEPHVDEEPKTHHPTGYGAMDDEDILEEIRLYQQTYEDEAARQHHNATALQLQARFWMYNRRLSKEDSTPPRPVEPDNVLKTAETIRMRTPQRTEHSSYFRYNRIVGANLPYK